MIHDALAELICQPAGDRKFAGTDLLVIADFDVLKQQLDNPRLADGSPIPIVELHRLALEANLLPSIFDTKAQDMWLGRRLRTATAAQRVALIARDQQCVGCGANPLWCRVHHVVWWSKNGPTDLDNLVLVCDDCHHKIHDHGWQVYKHPKTGRFRLKPPSPSVEFPTVSSGESSRTASGEPSTRPSGECSAVLSGELPDVSPDRADGVRSHADSAQPITSDAIQSTSRKEPGVVHVEEVRRENETVSDTERQQPAAGPTDYDPVDGIDTS